MRGLGLIRTSAAQGSCRTPEICGVIRKCATSFMSIRGQAWPLIPTMTSLPVFRRFNRRVKSAFRRRYADAIPSVIMRLKNIQLERTGPAQFAMQGIVRSVLEISIRMRSMLSRTGDRKIFIPGLGRTGDEHNGYR